MNNNYFEDIEQAAAEFAGQHCLPTEGLTPVNVLANILQKRFGYTIIEGGLSEFPELAGA